MKAKKPNMTMLGVFLAIALVLVLTGCKEKKAKILKTEPVEMPVKRLYVPFADKTAEESTEITDESDDYLLEEPLEPSDEEAEDAPNTYPEEELGDDEPEWPDEQLDEDPNAPEEEPNDSPEEDPNESWL